MPSIPLPVRLREEILAELTFTFSVIPVLPQVGLAEGTLLESLTGGISMVLGRAVLVVPFAISIVAVEIWREEPAEQRTRRTAGGVLATLSVVGILALGAPDAPVR